MTAFMAVMIGIPVAEALASAAFFFIGQCALVYALPEKQEPLVKGRLLPTKRVYRLGSTQP